MVVVGIVRRLRGLVVLFFTRSGTGDPSATPACRGGGRAALEAQVSSPGIHPTAVSWPSAPAPQWCASRRSWPGCPDRAAARLRHQAFMVGYLSRRMRPVGSGRKGKSPPGQTRGAHARASGLWFAPAGLGCTRHCPHDRDTLSPVGSGVAAAVCVAGGSLGGYKTPCGLSVGLDSGRLNPPPRRGLVIHRRNARMLSRCGASVQAGAPFGFLGHKRGNWATLHDPAFSVRRRL